MINLTKMLDKCQCENSRLRDRIIKVEAQRDGLKDVLCIIQSGFEYRNGDPKMDGTFDRFPYVLNMTAMKEIASKALTKMEYTCPTP